MHARVRKLHITLHGNTRVMKEKGIIEIETYNTWRNNDNNKYKRKHKIEYTNRI